jgi:hypothetical protein
MPDFRVELEMQATVSSNAQDRRAGPDRWGLPLIRRSSCLP